MRILGVPIGLDFMSEVGMERINEHVMGLTRRALLQGERCDNLARSRTRSDHCP